MSLFFLICVILVHFDPTRLRLTIVLPFMPLFIILYMRPAVKNMLPVYLATLVVGYPVLNYLTFGGFSFSSAEFIKTYVLYLASGIIHICVVYLPLRRIKIDLGKMVIPALYCILAITSAQFFGALILKTTMFYNPFGPFQYNNQALVEELTAGTLPRTQGFFLEPSYLGFVTITLISINLMQKYREKITLLLGGMIIFMSGSRGGLVGLLLIVIWFFFNDIMRVKAYVKVIYILLLLAMIPAFLLFSNIPALFSPESLATQNTSQYVRFYSGFQLSLYVLQHYYLGLPLGSIEQSFSTFLQEENTAYSFLFFNILYHGWLSIVLLLFFGISIYLQRTSVRYKVYLALYVLLYFNMTGSIIAPDTYFWFFCFYYTYRIYSPGSAKILQENL